MRMSLRGTSTRTIVAILAVALAEQALSRRQLHRSGLPLMGWGYLQYRLSGSYRIRRAGGPRPCRRGSRTGS